MLASTLVVAVLGVTLVPVAVAAQTAVSGAIAGTVRDTSGAALPGVTVGAASAALIEKARTPVTDDQGRYRVVDLRPGLYTVTFTLPGFSTVRREGLELTTGFTAAINAELRVDERQEPIIEPNTMFEDRRRQLDVRLSGTFEACSTILLKMIELSNALNTSPLLASNATYGARWLVPVDILSGRLLKRGAQFTF